MASKVGQRIVKEAITWLGTPWVKSGQSRKGVDCLNWIGAVGKVLGILFDLLQQDYSFGFWKRYDGDLIIESIEDAQQNRMRPGYELVTLGEADVLEPGDILAVCQLRKLTKATHVVFVEKIESWGISILHANQEAKKVERCNRMPLRWRILKAFRVTEVDDG